MKYRGTTTQEGMDNRVQWTHEGTETQRGQTQKNRQPHRGRKNRLDSHKGDRADSQGWMDTWGRDRNTWDGHTRGRQTHSVTETWTMDIHSG